MKQDGPGQRLYGKSPVAAAPKEFARDANILQTLTLNLATARDLRKYEIGGTCIWCQAATSLGANADIRINDQLRDPVNVSQGFFLRGIPFSRLYITNTAQAGETITLFYCVEGPRNIQVENPSVQYTGVTLSKATTFESVADVNLPAAATTVILAANANRRTAIFRNLPGNTKTFRIGDSNAGATRGIPLAPGDSIAFETTEAIYGYNPAGAAETIAAVWTED